MEAVPRMPMLAFELKTSPEQVEFGQTLKSYISTAYHEDGNAYSKECSELDALRISAVNVSRDFMGCSTLKKYFCQLKFLESRFPMGEGGQSAVPFTWEDPYVGRQYMVADIRFEQAAILYNIGTLHSILGAADNRQTPEGMKVSCTHFQCAAWAYQHLRDTYGPSAGVEYTHDFLTFHINLMLAQSQECILEKSMTDNRKSTITAKVAAQIVEYYRLALTNLEASNAINFVGNRKFKDWKKRIELKSHYHRCVMDLHMGLQAEEHQKWGERVVWFNHALQQLNDSIKLAKNEESDIDEALRFTMDVVGGKYNNAKKDNDFVYHEKLPEFESLPEVKGASLVKGIPFNPNDPEVAGADIFQRLVPMEAHEASSLYSEEKAMLLRQVGAEVEEKDAELSQFLSSLSLDKSLLNPEPFRLPQQLLDKCAALSVKPDTINDLKKAMTALANVATDVGSMVAEIQGMLKTEEEQEKDFQEKFGVRSPNTVLSDIGKESSVLKEQCEKGGQSDLALHRAMQNHINDLTLLTLPPSELEKALPAIEEKTPEEEAIHMEMNRLMDKIDEMRTQRETLHATVRQNVHEDDITTALVTREEGDQEGFFAEQLKKHDKLISLLHQNLGAQENILRAVTEANAKYAPIRKRITETIARREAKIASLTSSYEAYENLLGKSQRGLEYYKKLEDKASRALERARNLIKAEVEGREARFTKLKPKGPPPSRPTAPKPGQEFPGMPPGGIPGLPEGFPIPGVSPTGGGMMPAELTPDLTEKPRAPTLKDYLPFMKPATFGPKAGSQQRIPHPGVGPGGLGGGGLGGVVPGGVGGGGVDQFAISAPSNLSQIPHMPAGQGSLPNSQSSSPIHLPPQPSSQPASPARSGTGPQPITSQYSAHNMAQIPPGGPPYQPGVPHQHMMRHTPSPQQVPGSPSLPPASLATPSPTSQQLPTSQPLPGPQQQQQLPQQQQQLPQQPTLPHPQQYLPPGIQPPLLQPQPPQPAPLQPAPPQASQMSVGGVPIASVQPMISSHQQQLPQSTSPHPAPATQTAKVQPYSSSSQVPPPQGLAPVAGQLPGVQRPDSVQIGVQPGGQGAVVSSQQGYPLASSQQATMRDEAAHTVDMLHTPIASPGETPSSYIGAQPGTWTAPISGEHRPGSASHTPGQHQSLVNQSQTAPASVTPGYQPTPQQQPKPAPAPSSATVPNTYYPPSQVPQYQPAGMSSASGAYPQPAPTASQYAGYTGYQAAKPAQPAPQQYPATSLPAQTGPVQQYPQAYPQQAQYPAGYNPQYGQGVSGQSQAGPTGTAVSQYAYSSVGGAVTGPAGPAQITKPGYQPAVASVKPQQNYPTGPAGSAQVTVPGTGRQPYQAAPGGQPQYQPPGASGYPTQRPPTATPQPTTLSYPQTGTTGYPGYQAGPQSQGYRYPTPQQQPQQVQVPGTATAQGYPTSQGYAPPASYQQGYIQPGVKPGVGQAQASSVTPGKAYGAAQPPPGAAPVVSRTASAQPNYAGQVPQASGYGQQVYGGQYQTPQPGVQPGGGYPAGTAGTAAPVNYPGYQSQQPAIPTTQTQAWSGYKQGQTPTPTPQQQQQPQQPQQQYQYYMQQQQQQQQQQQRGSPSPLQPAYSQYNQGQQYQVKPQQAQVNTGYTQQGTQPRYGHPQVNATMQQAQQYPGYGQYSQQQQYPQQSYPAQPQPQQPAAQPPTQLPINATNQPLPNQSQSQNSFFTSPDSPQVALPSPLQPSLPSPVQPNPQQVPQQPPQQRSSSAPPEGQPAQRPQTIERQNSHTSTTSSLDDILSSSPDIDSVKKESGMLTPKVITAEEIQQQKEEELKKSLKQQGKCDPYEEKAALDRFVAEVEKFEKLVDALEKHTLSGPTPLENEWKELGDEQVKMARQHSQGIARCYPAKNRSPDVMPYDHNRVILKDSPDDYINASFIGDLAPCCPKFITTQSPLPVTMEDFWQMVHEQGTEVLVMLAHEGEAGMKIHRYWPGEKGQPLQHGKFTLTLQSVKVKQFWVERIMTLAHKESRQSRSVVHLQFLHWPPSGSPESPNHLLSFIAEVHTFYIQQRTLIRPVIIHCSDGVGRTGAFCIIYTAVQEVNQGNGVRDVAELVRILRERRKYMVQEKEQLAFCYRAILYHCQSLLIKRGIITNKASFGDKIPRPGEKSHQRKPSEDFILGNATSLSAIQSSVAKMTVKSSTPPPSTDASQDSTTSSLNGDHAVSSPTTEDGVVMVTPGGLTSDPVILQGPVDGAAGGSETDLSGMGSPVVQRSRSASGSSGVSPASASPQHQQGSTIAQSLADLQNPDKFSLDMGEVPHKPKKFSKAEFHKGGRIQDSGTVADPSDPLSLLDPLWSVKDKPAS